MKNKTTEQKPSKKLWYGAALLLVALVIITYSKVFDNEFVDWDDFTYVVNNELVRSNDGSVLHNIFTTPVSSNYHPLTILSLRLNSNDCRNCPNGISPVPFIRGNIILHIINTLLVLVIAYHLGRKNLFVAFFTAAVFGLHPLHTESVAWISERKDLLSSFFLLSATLSWLFYLARQGRGRQAYLVLCFILFVAAVLSKATTVIFPLLMLLISFWMNGSQNGIEGLKEWYRDTIKTVNLLTIIPFLAVSLLFGFMAYKIQNGQGFLWVDTTTTKLPDVVGIAGPEGFFQRILVAAYGFTVYIFRFVLPLKFSAIYPYPPAAEFSGGSFSILLWGSLLFLVTVTILTVISLRRTKLMFFGLGFYFLTVMLVLQFLPVGIAITADRYTYIPYIGLAFLVGTAVSSAAEKLKTPLVSLSFAYLVLMMILTIRQSDVWQNTETLWNQTIKHYPVSDIPRASRGKYYSRMALQSRDAVTRRSLHDKALADFLSAIKAGSKNTDVYDGAGYIYGLRGELKNALVCLDRAIELDRKNGSAYYNRALVMGLTGKREEAIRDYNSALLYKPQKAVEILTNRSNLYLETGRFSEAIPDFDYLITNDPGNYLFYLGRAVSKQATGDSQGAIKDYENVLKIRPGEVQATEQLKKLREQAGL